MQNIGAVLYRHTPENIYHVTVHAEHVCTGVNRKQIVDSAVGNLEKYHKRETTMLESKTRDFFWTIHDWELVWRFAFMQKMESRLIRTNQEVNVGDSIISTNVFVFDRPHPNAPPEFPN